MGGDEGAKAVLSSALIIFKGIVQCSHFPAA